jgi:16S rRNA (uracil1498-N3)-methyltransferase
LVEKLVELGVSSLIPLTTQRGVAQFSEGAAQRLRRYVIEASKQCGRNRLMEIAEPQGCEELFQKQDEASRLVAHPSGRSLRDTQIKSPCLIAVGPEGGFTDEELAAAGTSGWAMVDLGPRILRVETAAIALAAWVAGQFECSPEDSRGPGARK